MVKNKKQAKKIWPPQLAGQCMLGDVMCAWPPNHFGSKAIKYRSSLHFLRL